MLKRETDLTTKHLLIRRHDTIAIISINRARLRNTLSIETIQELTSLFRTLAQDRTLVVIVLQGLGEAFAAGADIKELLQLSATTAVDFSLLGGQLFDSIREAPQIVIAAIDGFCMGGGLDLALACDLRYASETAIFAHPGANIGIVTGFGGTKRLPQAVGLRQATEIFATAQRFEGQQAYQKGLIQALAVGQTGFELALARAHQIALQGLDRVARLKRLMQSLHQTPQPQAMLLLSRIIEFNRVLGKISGQI